MLLDSRYDLRGRRLESWKEISAYLGRDVRTAQRWERNEGLPVRRLQHSKSASLYAYAEELDEWRSARQPVHATARPILPHVVRAAPSSSIAVLPFATFSGDQQQEYIADGDQSLGTSVIGGLSSGETRMNSAETSVTIERDLKEIEQQLATAWRNGDCARWGAFIAPEWSVIHISGQVITRAEALEMCRAAHVPIEASTVDDVSVRAFGDAAVVTGRTVVTAGGAAPETVRLRFTDVFIRREGRWQVVASHATRLTS
jgi:ketosteroid isomerase-like protein